MSTRFVHGSFQPKPPPQRPKGLQNDYVEVYVDHLLDSFQTHLDHVDATFKRMDLEEVARKKADREYNDELQSFLRRHTTEAQLRPPVDRKFSDPTSSTTETSGPRNRRKSQGRTTPRRQSVNPFTASKADPLKDILNGQVKNDIHSKSRVYLSSAGRVRRTSRMADVSSSMDSSTLGSSKIGISSARMRGVKEFRRGIYDASGFVDAATLGRRGPNVLSGANFGLGTEKGVAGEGPSGSGASTATGKHTQDTTATDTTHRRSSSDKPPSMHHAGENKSKTDSKTETKTADQSSPGASNESKRKPHHPPADEHKERSSHHSEHNEKKTKRRSHKPHPPPEGGGAMGGAPGRGRERLSPSFDWETSEGNEGNDKPKQTAGDQKDWHKGASKSKAYQEHKHWREEQEQAEVNFQRWKKHMQESRREDVRRRTNESRKNFDWNGCMNEKQKREAERDEKRKQEAENIRQRAEEEQRARRQKDYYSNYTSSSNFNFPRQQSGRAPGGDAADRRTEDAEKWRQRAEAEQNQRRQYHEFPSYSSRNNFNSAHSSPSPDIGSQASEPGMLGGCWKERRVELLEGLYKVWEKKWNAAIDLVKASKPVSYDDIPWIPPYSRVSWINELDDSAAKKRKIQKGLLNWHPDKFFAMFGGMLVDEDRERVMEAVTEHAGRLFKESEDIKRWARS